MILKHIWIALSLSIFSYTKLFKTTFGERVRILPPNYFWCPSNVEETRHLVIILMVQNKLILRYIRKCQKKNHRFLVQIIKWPSAHWKLDSLIALVCMVLLMFSLGNLFHDLYFYHFSTQCHFLTHNFLIFFIYKLFSTSHISFAGCKFSHVFANNLGTF